MANQVIHIFGASGSGVTTLGRHLSENLGYFLMDVDDYFWQDTPIPYTVKRDKAERLSMLRADIEKHGSAVVSGSLTEWGDELIPLFTLAVRLTTDTETRLERLRKRESEHFGARIEPGGDMHEAHIEFINWASQYDTGGIDMRSKLCHDEWQKLLKCPLIELDGRLPLQEKYSAVCAALK